MSTVAPTFMFGMERSGTTLLSMMIGAHPDISVPLATTGMWFDVCERLDSEYGGMRDAADIDRLVEDVLAHERVAIWNRPLDAAVVRGAVRPGDFGSLVAAVHAECARAEGKHHWANMDIATLDYMHIANRWFDDARFVHIVRDGRDVGLSHQTMPYGSGNLYECAEAWVRRVTMNLRMGDILGPDRYLSFHYEDLVRDTEATLRQLCDFIGVPFDKAMLHYDRTVSDRVPDDKMWLWPALTSKPQTNKIDQWKTRMSADQRALFEGVAGPLLRELGYEAYEAVPRRVGAYVLELYFGATRGGRMNRLRRKLGMQRKSALERAAGA